jgi:hypothetical protein
VSRSTVDIPKTGNAVLDVDGREVRLTNLDKVFWAAEKTAHDAAADIGINDVHYAAGFTPLDISASRSYHQDVRTTLTLDDDVAAQLKKLMARRGVSLKQLVNDALREGLSLLGRPPAARKPYRTKPWTLGGSLVGSLDNVEEVLSRVEGERHR